ALPSMPRPSIEARSPGQAVLAANVLGAGWKSPPAVMASDRLSPRAPVGAILRGQHFVVKGTEAALACARTIENFAQIAAGNAVEQRDSRLPISCAKVIASIDGRIG